MISARAITLMYSSGHEVVTALNAVSVNLPSTGLVGIVGPSGSGKTSLLYVLAGIRQATEGEVIYAAPLTTGIQKKDKTAMRRKSMGFVFQYHFLISYLPVLDNVLVGSSKMNAQAVARAKSLLKQVGLEGYEHRRPFELSGGQRQRVAVARALMNDPKVIFVDEPTASLDKATAQEVINLLEEVSSKVCVVVVTHDPTILTVATQTYTLRSGELV